MSDLRSMYMSWRGAGRLSPRLGDHQDRPTVAQLGQPTVVAGVPGWLRRAVGQVLRQIWASQVLMGSAMAGYPSIYDASEAVHDPESRSRPLLGPPPGHPERLVPNATLDAGEWVLWADILGREPGG